MKSNRKGGNRVSQGRLVSGILSKPGHRSSPPVHLPSTLSKAFYRKDQGPGRDSSASDVRSPPHWEL
jgi:hypothetical protein